MMFISYKGEIYNLALMIKIYIYDKTIKLCSSDNTSELKCESKEEAEGVLNNIHGVTQCRFIDYNPEPKQIAEG